MNVSGRTLKVYFITLDHAMSHAATCTSRREMWPCRTQPVKCKLCKAIVKCKAIEHLYKTVVFGLIFPTMWTLIPEYTGLGTFICATYKERAWWKRKHYCDKADKLFTLAFLLGAPRFFTGEHVKNHWSKTVLKEFDLFS